jgi:hypothetical protein
MNRYHIATYALIAFFIAWIIPDQWIGEVGLIDHDLPPASYYQGDVRITSVSWGDGRPYVTLKSEFVDRPIAITGWSIENEKGYRGIIRNGVRTLGLDMPPQGESIYIGTGTTAYLLSERSPVGISFERNMCSGFLGGVQDFSPVIARECPDMTQYSAYTQLDQACTDFLSRIPACETLTPSHLSIPLSPACVSFITKMLTYQGCVDLHKNEEDFLLPAWHIYLDTQRELVIWPTRRDSSKLSAK